MTKPLILISLFFLFISGCSQSEQQYDYPPTIEGYIGSMENKSILVVSGITKEQALNLDRNELIRITEDKKGYGIFSFRKSSFFQNFSRFEEGQKVKAWAAEGAEESYPPQAKLGKIELVE